MDGSGFTDMDAKHNNVNPLTTPHEALAFAEIPSERTHAPNLGEIRVANTELSDVAQHNPNMECTIGEVPSSSKGATIQLQDENDAKPSQFEKGLEMHKQNPVKTDNSMEANSMNKYPSTNNCDPITNEMPAAKGSNETDGTGVEMEEQRGMEMRLLATVTQCKGNFLKGCKWAPDGLCLMYNSDDNVIRLINTPTEVLAKHWDTAAQRESPQVCLQVREAEMIYDYTWWPLMSSLYPATCCFATTARDQPIHLWDAFTGRLRATYIAKDQVDEVKAAHCIAFSPDGQQMMCGFSRELRLFYVDRPGDCCEVWPTTRKKCSSGQKGIISTADYNLHGSMVACGSYDGTAALYSTKNGELMTFLNCKSSGTTYVKYSQDGNRLYAGSRRNGDLICWDLRFLGCELFSVQREVETNQRIYFDLVNEPTSEQNNTRHERFLVSGGTDGVVSVWDIEQYVGADDLSTTIESMAPVMKHRAHRDCCNGVHLHPYLPVLASSSGQRHYKDFSSDSDDDEISDHARPSEEFEENTLKLWHINNLTI